MPKRIDPLDIRIGRRVRAYRLSRGMSQSALGEKVGVTFQQIQKYELGVNRIGSGRLRKFATILDVPIVALFGEDESGAGSETADTLVTEVLTQRYATRLLQAFGAVKDTKQRLAIVRLVESMTPGR